MHQSFILNTLHTLCIENEVPEVHIYILTPRLNSVFVFYTVHVNKGVIYIPLSDEF